MIMFSTTGQVRVAAGNAADAVAGPDGAAGFQSNRANYPYPGMAVGGLVAKVGNDKPFAIGSISTPISMQDNGRL
jgi:hypothetical protein